MSKKVCKKCFLMVEGGECPICKGTNFATSFQGRLLVVDPVHSEVAKKIGIEAKGEYAIKVR